LREIINSLIIESQKLLKEEWDKVKEESKRGDLKDNAHCIDTVLEHLNLWCLRVTKKAKTDDVELRPNANKRN
jgi:hypothetical protein